MIFEKQSVTNEKIIRHALFKAVILLCVVLFYLFVYVSALGWNAL